MPPRPDHIAAVPLNRATRMINHGPTVLVSAAHGGQRNVMAAAWNMALDFTPPKVAVVLDKSTWTRKLLLGEGSFALNIPTVAQADMCVAVGNVSGMQDDGTTLDKFAQFGIGTFAAEKISAPLVEGCAAWLECVHIPEPHIEETYDLFLAEVVAAWADTRIYRDGRWDFSEPSHRTIHHVAGGAFLVPGELVQGTTPPGDS